MDKLSWFMLLLFIITSFLYFCLFSIYLHNQYKNASKRFYKKKLRVEMYCYKERERNRNNRIKNNITETIDTEMINNRVGYAIIEFIDESGKISRTQIMYTPQLSIGRKDSNDIVLRGQKVSRNQCLIIYRNNNFFIRNLSKTNPTLLNETPIENKGELFFNDIIKIANYTLRFQEIINEPCVG